MLPLNARELTDLQWAVLDALIPEPPRRKDGRGRPWRSRRSVLNAFYGSAPALRGLICLNVIPLPDVPSLIPATGAVQESCEVSSKH
jgi:hypothetical protein